MRRLFLKIFRRRRLREDIEAELSFHREMSGQRQSPIPLGNTALITEQAFDLWRFNFIENLGQDLRYAWRTLLKSPGFLCVVVLSLALGIAANSTMFSVIDAELYRPLPFQDAGRLMVIWETEQGQPKFRRRTPDRRTGRLEQPESCLRRHRPHEFERA